MKHILFFFEGGVEQGLLAYCTSPGWRWVMMGEELLVERLAEETEVLRGKLPQRRFMCRESHITWATAAGSRATNRPCYGTAKNYVR
jgi:hypothetical protein